MASTAKFPHFIDINEGDVVQLQLIKANFNAALNTELGQVAGGGDSGEPPTGKNKRGKGKTAAMMNGCFGVVLVYDKTSSKTQSAKVLCSPKKADTIFENGLSKTYAGKNISDVRIPKRRVFTF